MKQDLLFHFLVRLCSAVSYLTTFTGNYQVCSGCTNFRRMLKKTIKVNDKEQNLLASVVKDDKLHRRLSSLNYKFFITHDTEMNDFLNRETLL